jgi:hypothetical protein
MHSDSARRGSGAIAIVSLIAMIVIGAGTVALVMTSGGSPSQSGVSNSSTTDQSLGLRLTLQVSPGSGPSGTDFRVSANVTNVLGRTNNATGLDEYHGVGSNPICKFAPVAFDVLQGHFTLANYTSGAVVNVHGPQNMMCVIGAFDLGYYVFSPNSDNFTGPSGQSGVNLSRSAQVTADVSDVWSQGFSPSGPLPAGGYTVVAADNWGQLAFAYFTVA